MDGMSVAILARLANSEIARSTLRFQYTVAPTPAELQDYADEVAAELVGVINPMYCPDITVFSVVTQTFTHVAAAPPKAAYWDPVSAQFQNIPVIGPGSHAGQSSTPQCAVVCSLRTGLAGRSFRGRLFGFPPPESDLDANGDIIGGHNWKSIVDEVVAAVLATPASATVEPVFSVFSATLNSAEPVVSTFQGQRVDTQRRRLSRSG